VKTQRRWFLWPRLPLLAGFLNLLASCSLQSPYLDICREFESLQTVPVLDQGVGVVFEDPGTIVVQHGFACARSDNGRFIKVEQSLDIPDYANQATVLLNGWRMNYSDDDHHVLVLTSVLGKIRFDQPRGAKKLTWQAIITAGAITTPPSRGTRRSFTPSSITETQINFVNPGPVRTISF